MPVKGWSTSVPTVSRLGESAWTRRFDSPVQITADDLERPNVTRTVMIVAIQGCIRDLETSDRRWIELQLR
jgi:hypothetical protein